MAASIQLQALGDFFGKYKQVFSETWQNRQQLESPVREPHELQFLPAALSLQETPLSPAPRYAIRLIIGFAVLVLLWACFGKMDVVAIASGKIIPGDRSKTLQAIDTATVKAIYVRDGQTVKEGDLLVELDATSAMADADRLRSNMASARLQVLRAQTLLAALDTGKLPEPQRPEGVSNSQWQEAQTLLRGQYAEYLATQKRINAELARRDQDMRATQKMVEKLERIAPLAKQRSEDFKNLVDKNYVSKYGYMEQEQARIEQEGNLASLRNQLKSIEATKQGVSEQLSELTAQSRRVNLDSINDGQQKISALQQELIKADRRNQLLQLRAPVAGNVQQLAIHTLGGVVTPAQPLMVIVPNDNSLEIEAFVDNKDIGFVKPGQTAEVKIETFQFTRYGTLHAEVVSVSHDAINDEKRGLIYSARVKLAKSSIMVNGTPVNLSPGMAVTVEVKTNRRRIIDYFLSPLIQHGNESLRER